MTEGVKLESLQNAHTRNVAKNEYVRLVLASVVNVKLGLIS
jgi:hypothetical protein